MIKLHGKNLKGVSLSVHLTEYGLVLIEDENSKTFSFDNIIDIVYHDDKARTGRLDINLKKPERVIMVVGIKEKKSLDRFLELANKYRETTSKKDFDKKIAIAALLTGLFIGIFLLFSFIIGLIGILIGGYIMDKIAKDYKHDKLYIVVSYAFAIVFSIVFRFIYYRMM
jgi:hypothetical protein